MSDKIIRENDDECECLSFNQLVHTLPKLTINKFFVPNKNTVKDCPNGTCYYTL